MILEQCSKKIDLRTAARNTIPVVFDLRTRKAIWVDLVMNANYYYGGNNIHSNRASIKDQLEAIVNANHKLSLYELFNLHAVARGSLASAKEDADTVFSVEEGVTPFCINEINAEFVD